MQAYEPLQGILNYLKTKKKVKINIQNIKVFINSKVKIFIKSRS